MWQNLLLWAESGDVPPELWDKLSEFVDKISDDAVQNRHDSGIIREYQEETADLIDKEVAIVYNQHFDKNILSKISKYRVNLNNVVHNFAKYGMEHKWMEELAELATEFDEPQPELNGFISLISLFRQNGAIITNSYSANIHKMLVKSNINVIYPGIKTETKKSEKIWEHFPLGGTINSFICTRCGYRTIKTEYYSKTLVECCNKCKSPMYPDIDSSEDNYSQILPQTWYNAYERLINSRIWVLMSPPSHNDQISMRNMILSAAKSSVVEEIYIITQQTEVYELWKSKLAKLTQKAEIKENFPNIVSLLETYNEASVGE